MTFRYNDMTVKTVPDFIRMVGRSADAYIADLSSERRPRFPGIWYRGLAWHEAELVPTLHRDGIAVSDESRLINRFKQNAHEFLDVRPQGEWEWIPLGSPSRLAFTPVGLERESSSRPVFRGERLR